MGGNRNSIIGFSLLFVLWIGYIWTTQPSVEDRKLYEEQIKAYNDSLATVDSMNILQDSLANLQIDSLTQLTKEIEADSSLSSEAKDSLIAEIDKKLKPKAAPVQYGSFSGATDCEGEVLELENDKLKIKFNTKGGRIVDVQVKDYKGYDFSTQENNHDKTAVHLLNNQRDKFSYFIPLSGVKGGGIETERLCFQPILEEKTNTLTFRAYADNLNQYIEQKYILSKEGYLLDYDLKLEGLGDMLPANAKEMKLTWHTYLNKIEKNPSYEQRMSSIHFKEVDKSPSYCTCGSSAEKELEKSIAWLSHTQQFFNTSLLVAGTNKPEGAHLVTKMIDTDSSHLKELLSELNFPLNNGNVSYDMQLYLGPNEYNTLSKIGVGLERIIPFGWSIFGVISRHIIRPLFNFFASFVPSYGLIIILLTLLIRLAMFPLQFRMLKSSVKMGILRPRLDAMKKKYKDDAQGMQMEQMKLYQQYGVSPLGGCLPMLLTTPIWIALYRFFPASIEFRQKSFLWADDLVSYDSIWDFGYVPFIHDIYGDHVSLFTLLWSISMFAYLIYNSRQMDMTAGNPNAKMMKYMQFAFPVIFFFALNNWAAGLTCYMLFSNLFNIGQTFLVKNVLINKDKLEKEMEAKRKEREKNPKKNRWQQMMEDARKQQEMQRQNKNKKK